MFCLLHELHSGFDWFWYWFPDYDQYCHMLFAKDCLKRSCFIFVFSFFYFKCIKWRMWVAPNQVKVIFFVKQMFMAHVGIYHHFWLISWEYPTVIKRKKKPPRYLFLCHAWLRFYHIRKYNFHFWFSLSPYYLFVDIILLCLHYDWLHL